MQQAYGLLPHLKITELLLEIDSWTGFSRHFKHLKSGEATRDQNLLLTTILADAINLHLSKIAESCPGTTYAKLTWLQAWHIRDETYSTALAELVNAQFRQPIVKERRSCALVGFSHGLPSQQIPDNFFQRDIVGGT